MKPIIIFLASILIASTCPAQDWAKAKLEKSPRHQEWMKVKHGNREVNCFVVFPEVKNKATAIVLIHEIFGLTDWARCIADELAEAGYIVVAPDLLSGMGAKGGGTGDFAGEDAAIKAVSGLAPDQITADLNAAADYAARIPAANGKVAVAGFCWGGGQTFRFSTNNKEIKAAFVFYGPGPSDPEEAARIQCPVHGFYAGNDARITVTIPQTAELMKKAGKTYELVTYEGAGHGFMRAGESPDAKEPDKKARSEAWTRLMDLLKKIGGN